VQVVITGGELFNKGAQAMVFAVVSEVKTRFPDAQVTLLSTTDFNRSDDEKARYQFQILPWDIRLKLRRLPIIKWLIERKHFSDHDERLALESFSNADWVIDVSGYGLASVFSKIRVLNYLFDLYLAKKMNRQMALMPQSFGPFNFGFGINILFNWALKSLIQHPAKTFAREQDGFELMKPYRKGKHLALSPDMVIQSEPPKEHHIFAQKNQSNDVVVEDNAVAIIPNEKIFKHNAQNDLHETYNALVNMLLNHGKAVYLLRHSYEDLKICKKIKANFADNDKVILNEADMNAYELAQFIERMDFVVASRYHAVVHAYRDGVPALVLGWAVKYVELMKKFQQQQYCLDVRTNISEEMFKGPLEALCQHSVKESETIRQCLDNVKEINVFNEVLGAHEGQVAK
jgi:colanic acid/amylovoran biosynthesis protein